MPREFAPGIPISRAKSNIPNVSGKYWQYTIHRHKAERAGEHIDFRLSDGKKAYSWAVRKGIPEPGQKYLAIRQPDHTPDYMNFKGNIESGYGKGKVLIDNAGLVRIIKSNPGKILLALLNQKQPEELVLLNTAKDKWLLINRTPTKSSYKQIPLYRDRYVSYPVRDLPELANNDNYIFQPKIDGAHVIIHVKPDNHPRLFSYVDSKRGEKLINHTFKVDGLDQIKIPAHIPEAVLRGEITGQINGNPIPINVLGSVLNSSTDKSLALQKLSKIKPIIYLFDVDRVKNKKISDASYGDKLKILQQYKKILKQKGIDIRIPETVNKPEDKLALFSNIEQGKYKETNEGVVVRDLNASAQPIRVKVRPDFDVYIRKIFPVTVGKNANKIAGGFEYSWTPNGKIIGRVGTGFDNKLKEDMWKNKSKYIGRVARVKALGKYPTGVLRAPAFIDFHIEKGLL